MSKVRLTDLASAFLLSSISQSYIFPTLQSYSSSSISRNIANMSRGKTVIITIPDDDCEIGGSTMTASKGEAPPPVSSDSSMCQSDGSNAKKIGLNPDPATANAARGHSTYSRSTSVDGISSGQAIPNLEPRSRSQSYHAAFQQKSNSAHPDGMSLSFIFVTQQGLMVESKASSYPLNTIPKLQRWGTVLALQLPLSHSWGLGQWPHMVSYQWPLLHTGEYRQPQQIGRTPHRTSRARRE